MSARGANRQRHALLLGLCMCVAGAAAQEFEITRHVVSGGGGRSTGGDYSLAGTVGQPQASGPIGGGEFELRGGFWAGDAQAGGEALFRDGFEAP